MADRIFMSPPDVTAAEEEAVIRAFRGGWIAPLGPEVDAFEKELAEFCGRDHAVALSSGTAALHLALIQLGAGPGDVVVTSTMTFAATANAIVYTGAEPVFVDCDDTGSMDPDLLATALAELAEQGRTVRALVPVDLLGKVVDHEATGRIAAEHGIPVLSDAAESVGATRNGRPAPAYGVAAAVSFNGNKIMTTSGGGALLTDDADMAARTRYLATQARQPVVHYEHVDVGYNYRLSNLLAALGRAQLERLPQMIDRRHAIRRAYIDLADDLGGVTVFGLPDASEDGSTRDNAWLTSILIDEQKSGYTSGDLQAHLAGLDIEARPLWKPMHLQPVFEDRTAFVNGTSERLFRTGLSLPSGSAHDEATIERVCEAIRTFAETPR
ncbi:dTDP-4-amino-4,6-dideoxygalactose transaminase [Brachybacterium sp. AG952]|uniref:DegT/DnrJ/EryC1/StrS family aminotransferase n=1 Tax=Brachybacterium sp. AG952 TaxID=2183989 RepID=UPI00106114FE|nr:aminotransferase class I/II-fold pyridoxal phosphate-dependent enzyme [Brachybacterium sp. AG952]TDP80080.1 dTDP-4-amino-4,6-dideoxygalactose transaminase [Brachybacterium sp. AG952]